MFSVNLFYKTVALYRLKYISAKKCLTPFILNKMNRRTLWKADNFRYLYGDKNDTLYTRSILVGSIGNVEAFTGSIARYAGHRTRPADRSRRSARNVARSCRHRTPRYRDRHFDGHNVRQATLRLTKESRAPSLSCLELAATTDRRVFFPQSAKRWRNDLYDYP